MNGGFEKSVRGDGFRVRRPERPWEDQRRLLNIQLAMPKELGGPGSVLANSEQLFAAGHVACVDATVGIGQRESGGFGLAVRLEVTIPNLHRDQAQKLLEAADAACPYSNAGGNVDVELSLV